MNANEIINYIKNSNKTTAVTVYLNYQGQPDFKDLRVYHGNNSAIIKGDYAKIKEFLSLNEDLISDVEIENDSRNSAIPLLDLKNINARIEPGAIIREQVEIGNNAVIMMGAIINIGAVVGANTMIDMGAVLGGRAVVGNNCHIGANTVLAGVIEPASAKEVVVEDNVLIGANATVIEGVRIGENAVVAAGAVVIEDVAANSVVAGIPARVIKVKDGKTISKTSLVEALRSL